jgi:hypothetical protein
MDQEIVLPEAAPQKSSSLMTRIAFIVFFAFVGVMFSAGTLVGSPRFWYVPVAIMLLLSASLWFRPKLGASASLPFCILLSYLMLSSISKEFGLIGPVALTSILVATVICVIEIKRRGAEIKPLVASVVLIILSLAADLTFTNRVEERPLQMSWVADGTDPTGDQAQLSSKGEKPVILFTPVAGGYCTDTIYSEPLREKLNALHKPQVQVVYNEFKNFGRIHGYNVGSIEGMVFNKGLHVVIPNPEGSSEILVGDKSTEANPNAPATCPR